MNLKRIGIVLKRVSGNYIIGDLVSAGVTSINIDGYIKVEEKIHRIPFKMERRNGENFLETDKSIDFFCSKEVYKALQEVGYKNIVLLFNGKEYRFFNFQ